MCAYPDHERHGCRRVLEHVRGQEGDEDVLPGEGVEDGHGGVDAARQGQHVLGHQHCSPLAQDG